MSDINNNENINNEITNNISENKETEEKIVPDDYQFIEINNKLRKISEKYHDLMNKYDSLNEKVTNLEIDKITVIIQEIKSLLNYQNEKIDNNFEEIKITVLEEIERYVVKQNIDMKIDEKYKLFESKLDSLLKELSTDRQSDALKNLKNKLELLDKDYKEFKSLKNKQEQQQKQTILDTKKQFTLNDSNSPLAISETFSKMIKQKDFVKDFKEVLFDDVEENIRKIQEELKNEIKNTSKNNIKIEQLEENYLAVNEKIKKTETENIELKNIINEMNEKYKLILLKLENQSGIVITNTESTSDYEELIKEKDIEIKKLKSKIKKLKENMESGGNDKKVIVIKI